jgi:hypothetical protein
VKGVSLDFICRNALSKCRTLEQQRPWLLRLLGIAPVAAKLKRFMMTRCRACGLGATGGDDDAASASEAVKLRKCGQCSFSHYCSSACQKGDWKRHKAWCAGALEGTPEAMAAEAVCSLCCSSLLLSDSDDAAAAAPAAARFGGRVNMRICLHLDHLACTLGAASCGACGMESVETTFSPAVEHPTAAVSAERAPRDASA